MSRRTWPRLLDDLIGFRANLLITCRACGNQAEFSAFEVIDFFRASRWPRSWDLVAQRFDCWDCKSKDVRAEMKTWPPPPPPPSAPPQPIARGRDLKR
jgi:hypothetical protein